MSQSRGLPRHFTSSGSYIFYHMTLISLPPVHKLGKEVGTEGGEWEAEIAPSDSKEADLQSGW